MWESLLKRMENSGDKPFVAGRKENYTYADLRKCCSYFNTLYRRKECRRVLLSAGQGFLSYSAIIAAYMTGSTFCIINPELPLERKKYMAEQFNPDLILCNPLDELMETADIAVLSMKQVGEEALKYEGAGIRKEYEEDMAYVLFTSGTTGLPKGCMIKRKGFDAFCKWASGAFELSEQDRFGQYVPLYFDMSLIDLFGGVMHGVTLVPFPTATEKLRPGVIVKNYGVTFLNVVPQFMELLQRTNQFTGEYLQSLRMIRFGGDKIHRQQLEHLFHEVPGIKVLSTYGPTETTCFCFYRMVTEENYEEHTRDIVSIGNTIPGWNSYLADEENGVGEIVIYGPYIGMGYLSDTGEDKFRREMINGVMEETYHTGDYARIENGEHYFEGRRDAQIKINGNRISLNEVEYAMLKTGVRETAAVFVEENIFCFYAEEEGARGVTENERKLMLQEKLPRYAIPSFCIKLDALPMNANGKIDRRELRERAKDIMDERSKIHE